MKLILSQASAQTVMLPGSRVVNRQCLACGAKLCIEVCSCQAIYPGETAVPNFDYEKCVPL